MWFRSLANLVPDLLAHCPQHAHMQCTHTHTLSLSLTDTHTHTLAWYSAPSMHTCSLHTHTHTHSLSLSHSLSPQNTSCFLFFIPLCWLSKPSAFSVDSTSPRAAHTWPLRSSSKCRFWFWGSGVGFRLLRVWLTPRKRGHCCSKGHPPSRKDLEQQFQTNQNHLERFFLFV